MRVTSSYNPHRSAALPSCVRAARSDCEPALAAAEKIALALRGEDFSTVDGPCSLDIEPFFDEVRMKLVARAVSVDEHDSTFVKLHWRGLRRELLICQLRVASRYRRRGVGKKMVAICERLAFQLNVHSIQVFPLQKARAFWTAVGYQPHASVSRVLTKPLATQKRGEINGPETGDC